MIWYDMIWHDENNDMIWYDMTWYDMIWHDMTWYDMTWYDMIWYDMTKYDINCEACIITYHNALSMVQYVMYVTRVPYLHGWWCWVGHPRSRGPGQSQRVLLEPQRSKTSIPPNTHTHTRHTTHTHTNTHKYKCISKYNRNNNRCH